jgi:MmyB-like transcription regulator ligand binding domain/Helix-turn-helix domain
MPTSERNLDRASFLKSRRQRLTPEQVGLPPSSRRRAATLRREDVAWLADVGVTWYTWLEQGRPIKIAAGTLARVAATLRLDDSETEYLQKLVHQDSKQRADWRTPVAERYRLLVNSYTGGHAFVMGPRWDILAWNARFGELFEFGDDDHPAAVSLERNGLWLMFTHPSARRLFPDWDLIARRMVATFRVEHADYARDKGFAELIEVLTARSPEFCSMWSHVDVLSPMRWSIGEIRDPRTGNIVALDTVSFSVPDAPGQTVVFHVPICREVVAVS